MFLSLKVDLILYIYVINHIFKFITFQVHSKALWFCKFIMGGLCLCDLGTFGPVNHIINWKKTTISSIDQHYEYWDNLFCIIPECKEKYETFSSFLWTPHATMAAVYSETTRQVCIFMARLTIVRGPYRFCPVRACIFCFHRKWYLWVSKRLLV